MKNFLSVFLLFVFLVSCRNDESLMIFEGDSVLLIENGIDFDSSGSASRTLRFKHPSDMNPVIEIQPSAFDFEWLHVEQKSVNAGEYEIIISADDNSGKSRSAVVKITVGQDVAYLEVRQDSAGAILTDTMVSVSRLGGKVIVECWAKKELEKPHIAERWVNISDFRKLGCGDYAVELEVDENEGFGRIASFYLHDGNEYVFVSIMQAPGEFGEEETVKTSYRGGDLALLLGYTGSPDDYAMNNIRRIKHLTINGDINVNDLDVIRHYTAKAEYPVFLDLRNAKFVSGASNPYGDVGYMPPKQESNFSIKEDGYIPDDMFNMARGLVGCVLPRPFEGAVVIGDRAFKSTALSRIDIPPCVIHIGDEAFSSNKNLEIRTSKYSNLKSLGDYPFMTGGYIDSMVLPRQLKRVTDKSLSGLKVHKLYIDHLNPPEWKFNTSTQIDTLYVEMENQIDVYRAAPGWGDIPTILAWPQSWEDEDEDWL